MNRPVGSWVVRARATLAVLVVAIVVIAAFIIPLLVEANPQATIAVFVVVALVLGAAAAIAFRATKEQQGAVEGLLASMAPWLPGAAAVTVVGLFLLGQSAPYAIGVGLVTTAVGFLAVAFLFTQYARADTAQPRNYNALKDRFVQLRAAVDVLAEPERLDTLTPPEQENASSARAELTTYVESIGSDLGLLPGTTPASGQSWALGTGYIDLWNRLHRAEEALIDLASDANNIAFAANDALRLAGSSIGNGKELARALADAVKTLEADEDPSHRVRARRVLRMIRHDINAFRDDVWDQMLELRHQLLTRMIFTGLVADIILVLALVAGVDQTAILAASVFYLVGAVIGLFARLQSETSSSSTVDDYGLADARLMVTPLISGLAAIAGVVLTAKLLLPGSDVLAPPVVDSSGKTAALSGEVRTPPELADIFNLDLNGGAVIVAAIFGLTPGLLLERLKSQGEKYKSDLQNSTATDGAT
jgi:hypothetical protein